MIDFNDFVNISKTFHNHNIEFNFSNNENNKILIFYLILLIFYFFYFYYYYNHHIYNIIIH
jgi:hypothetical protein